MVYGGPHETTESGTLIMASDQGPVVQSALPAQRTGPPAQGKGPDAGAGGRKPGVVDVQADQGGGRPQFDQQDGPRCPPAGVRRDVGDATRAAAEPEPRSQSRRLVECVPQPRTASEYLEYVGYETGAVFIRQFQGSVVPGLLQTPDYARALTVISVEEKATIDAVVGLRLQRQSELARRDPRPRQYYILDEAVVRRNVGAPEDLSIMPDQLMHIVSQVRDDDRITVRVIPFGKGAHAGLSGPFTLLEFDGGLSDLLYLDAGREVIGVVGNDDRIAEYADSFESLVEIALSAEESLEFIENAAREIS